MNMIPYGQTEGAALSKRGVREMQKKTTNLNFTFRNLFHLKEHNA